MKDGQQKSLEKGLVETVPKWMCDWNQGSTMYEYYLGNDVLFMEIGWRMGVGRVWVLNIQVPSKTQRRKPDRSISDSWIGHVKTQPLHKAMLRTIESHHHMS